VSGWLGGVTDHSQVHPLRIQKGTPSPTKLPRPLSELAPSEKRRNSPSYSQATKVGFDDPQPSEN
jgi:hypothetical protein